jgi:limonene-1,2-epoxide hydrolase
VVRQRRGRRVGRILQRQRRLSQHPAGAGHRQAGHREQHRHVHPPWRASIESLALRLINIVAEGPIVMTERVDVFKVPSKSFELQVMGVFEVRDGKIDARRDYFDMNQFTTRSGIAP